MFRGPVSGFGMRANDNCGKKAFDPLRVIDYEELCTLTKMKFDTAAAYGCPIFYANCNMINDNTVPLYNDKGVFVGMVSPDGEVIDSLGNFLGIVHDVSDCQQTAAFGVAPEFAKSTPIQTAVSILKQLTCLVESLEHASDPSIDITISSQLAKVQYILSKYNGTQSIRDSVGVRGFAPPQFTATKPTKAATPFGTKPFGTTVLDKEQLDLIKLSGAYTLSSDPKPSSAIFYIDTRQPEPVVPGYYEHNLYMLYNSHGEHVGYASYDLQRFYSKHNKVIPEKLIPTQNDRSESDDTVPESVIELIIKALDLFGDFVKSTSVMGAPAAFIQNEYHDRIKDINAEISGNYMIHKYEALSDYLNLVMLHLNSLDLVTKFGVSQEDIKLEFIGYIKTNFEYISEVFAKVITKNNYTCSLTVSDFKYVSIEYIIIYLKYMHDIHGDEDTYDLMQNRTYHILSILKKSILKRDIPDTDKKKYDVISGLIDSCVSDTNIKSYNKDPYISLVENLENLIK